MIIGITGTLGSGKGTVVDYLVREKGFNHYSMSGFLKEEMRKQGLEINLPQIAKFANELRAEFGPAYVAECLYDIAKSDGGNSVIESLRVLGEVEVLRQKGDFYLLSVDADIRQRYERIAARRSELDQVSWAEFVAAEKEQMDAGASHKQNLAACMAEADFCLTNNGTIEDLHIQLEEILSELLN